MFVIYRLNHNRVKKNGGKYHEFVVRSYWNARAGEFGRLDLATKYEHISVDSAIAQVRDLNDRGPYTDLFVEEIKENESV